MSRLLLLKGSQSWVSVRQSDPCQGLEGLEGTLCTPGNDKPFLPTCGKELHALQMQKTCLLLVRLGALLGDSCPATGQACAARLPTQGCDPPSSLKAICARAHLVARSL